MDSLESNQKNLTISNTLNNTITAITDEKKVMYIEEQFEIKTDLGQGGFAIIKLIEDKNTLDKFALKIIQRNSSVYLQKDPYMTYKREVDVLENVNHSNIIKLIQHGTYKIKKNHIRNSPCLILEYAENGCLFDYIGVGEEKGFPENIVKKIFLDILNGLNYLHKQGFVHGDLKTENIVLLSDWTVKLCDFGNSYQMKSEDKFNPYFGSSALYASPEILSGCNNNLLGDKNDVFSLGIILFALLLGGKPFRKAELSDQFYKKISENDPCLFEIYSRQFKTKFSDDFKNLFISMLSYKAKYRPTIEDIINSPWMKEGSIASEKEVMEEFERRKKLMENENAC